MTMHILPVYYTTTNTRKRKKKNKTKSLIAAEREHEKFLKRMGLNSHSSTNKAPKRSVAQFGSASALGAEGQRFKSSHSDQFSPCLKKDESYKLDTSSQYVIGQAYNKGNFQVLSKADQNDPATGKRR